MKRFWTLLLALVLTVSLLSGCSGSDSSSSDPSTVVSQQESEPVDDGPVEEVVMALFVAGAGNSSDVQMIEDAINEIIVEKINTRVKIEIIAGSNYAQQMTLMLTGGEPLDLMVVTGAEFPTYVGREQIIGLNDLLDQYGAGIKEHVGNFLRATSVDGEVYAVPTIRDYSRGGGLNIRKDLLDKYGIDPSSLKSLEDMTEVFRVVKEGEGADFYPLVIAGAGTSFLDNYRTVDTLNDSNGVLLNGGYDNTDVVLYEESEEYSNLLNLFWDWYQKGYIQKDIATTTESYGSIMRTGNAMCWFTNCKPGIQQVAERNTGYEIETVQFLDYFSFTGQVNSFSWAIAQNSSSPEAAMKFMNLMFSDVDVMTYLSYGLEDVHYVTQADGHVGYPEGEDQTTIGWSLNTSWLMGNQFLLPNWEGEPLDLWDKQKAANDNARMSMALGFVFDNSNVTTEVAAVQSVRDEYKRVVENGAGDPAVLIPEYVAKLKANGIERIISEKQSQLDAWIANQN